MKRYKTLKGRFNNLVLLINELSSKSFSFLLFWILGVKLTKAEFLQFTLEMPFIFLFSTVLSFGSITYFMEQKKSLDKLKINLNLSLSLVFYINLLIIFISVFLFFIDLVSYNYLLLIVVTISFNINQIFTEFFFVLKNNYIMACTNILPKMAFLISIPFLINNDVFIKEYIYYFFIALNFIFSFHIIFYLKGHGSMSKKWIIDYFKFTWILTLQPLLVYIAYMSFRYFISFKADDSKYLIEFSVLQTYMGFFALLVSLSNRFIIHDLYDTLIKKTVGLNLKLKISYFNKMFMLFSFIYFHVVIFYLNKKLHLDVSLNMFFGIFFMVIASLINYVSQFMKTIIIFDKNFSFILNINILSTVFSVLLSFTCMFFEINILYTLSLFLVNLIILFFYFTRMNKEIWNEIIPKEFIYKTTLFLVMFFIAQYFLYSHEILFSLFNILFVTFLLGDFYFYLKRNIDRNSELEKSN